MRHHSFHLMLTTAAVAVSLAIASSSGSFAQSGPAAPAKPAPAADQSGVSARPGARPPHHGEGRRPAAAQNRPGRCQPLAQPALHRPGAARAGWLHRDRLRHRPRASAPPAGAAERRRARRRAEGRLSSRCCATTTATARPTGSSATSRASTGRMGSPGATATCWSPTRTASGRCRTGSARCGPARAPANSKAADVPPEQRKPTPRLVGEKMITKKGVFGIVHGPRQPPSRDRSENRRAVRRRRLLRQHRRRARGRRRSIQRFDADGCEPDDLRVGHAQPDRARLPSRHRRPLRRGAGARRAGRQAGARLS